MTHASLRSIAAIACFFLAIAIARGLAKPQPSPEEPVLDSPERPSSRLRPDTPVLRIALMQLGPGSEALLDFDELALEPGKAFEASVGFRTPDQPTKHSMFGSQSAFGYNKSKWQRKIGQVRPLPSEFGHLAVQVDLHGKYFGEHDGWHLVFFERTDDHCKQVTATCTYGSNIGVEMHGAAFREDQPVARIARYGNLVLLAVLTKRPNEVVSRPGLRSEWLEAFRSVGIDPAVVDRAGISAAVEKLEPQGWQELESNSFFCHGPLVERITAAFVFRDLASLDLVARRCAQEPELLDKVFKAGLPGTWQEPSASYLSRNARPLELFFKAWLSDGDPQWPGVAPGHPWVAHMRLMSLARDEDRVARYAERAIESGRRMPALGFALATEEFGQTAAAREAYKDVRRAEIHALPAPWNIVLRSGLGMLAYALLVPLLAALAVFIRIRTPLARPGSVSRGLIFVLAFCSFVKFDGFALRILIVPLWWVLGRRYLRELGEPSWAQRGFVFLVLNLVTLDALVLLGWFFEHTALEASVDSGVLFAWILVGGLVLLDGRWRGLGFFAAYLWIFLAIGAAGILDIYVDPNLGILLLVALLACLFMFWRRGPAAAPRRRRKEAAFA